MPAITGRRSPVLEAFQPARLVANALAGFRADLQEARGGRDGSFRAYPSQRHKWLVTSAGTGRHGDAAAVQPIDAGSRRVTTSAMVAVAIAAAVVAVIVYVLLSLR